MSSCCSRNPDPHRPCYVGLATMIAASPTPSRTGQARRRRRVAVATSPATSPARQPSWTAPNADVAHSFRGGRSHELASAFDRAAAAHRGRKGRLQEQGSDPRRDPRRPAGADQAERPALAWSGAGPGCGQFSVYSGTLEWKDAVTDDEYSGKKRSDDDRGFRKGPAHNGIHADIHPGCFRSHACGGDVAASLLAQQTSPSGPPGAPPGPAAAQPPTVPPPSLPEVTYQDLLNGLKSPSRWLTYSGDYTGRRHSPLTQITPGNVSRLTAQWTFQGDTMPLGRGFEGTPLMLDGILYITGNNNFAWAIDSRTGAQLWRYRRQLPTGSPTAAPTSSTAGSRRSATGCSWRRSMRT